MHFHSCLYYVNLIAILSCVELPPALVASQPHSHYPSRIQMRFPLLVIILFPASQHVGPPSPIPRPPYSSARAGDVPRLPRTLWYIFCSLA